MFLKRVVYQSAQAQETICKNVVAMAAPAMLMPKPNINRGPDGIEHRAGCHLTYDIAGSVGEISNGMANGYRSWHSPKHPVPHRMPASAAAKRRIISEMTAVHIDTGLCKL